MGPLPQNQGSTIDNRKFCCFLPAFSVPFVPAVVDSALLLVANFVSRSGREPKRTEAMAKMLRNALELDRKKVQGCDGREADRTRNGRQVDTRCHHSRRQPAFKGGAERAAPRAVPIATPVTWHAGGNNDTPVASPGKLIWRARRLALLGLPLGLLAVTVGILLSDPLLSINNAKLSDAILVLDGDESNALRYQKALSLIAAGYGREVVVDANGPRAWSGAMEGDLIEGSSSATAKLLKANVNVCRTTATSTRTEAANANRCLSQLGAKRVLIVTSFYHTRRALSIFTTLLPQYEWSVAGTNPPTQLSPWLTLRRHVVTEWCKLLYWELVTRWRGFPAGNGDGLLVRAF